MNRILQNTLKMLCSARFSGVAVLTVFGLLFSAATARAGCGIPSKAGVAPAVPFLSEPKGAQEDDVERNSIVGLWHLIYTAESESGAPIFPPAPFQFLESYKTWHADGTEFENAFLPPAGGNICFGVWKNLKDGKGVKLHHLGLMFDAQGMVRNIFTIDEIDRVASDGKTYTGTFDFKLFDATDVYGTGSPIAEVKGKTAGTRITVGD
jgi:hypothetical protein